MFEVVFLGTAASVPTAERGMPALVVQHGVRRFLVDCGEGTQRQLPKSGLGYRHLDTVLLTHGHLDHVLGLGGLAATFSEWGTIPCLAIHGGADALGEARRFLQGVVMPGAGSALAIDFIDLTPGVVIEDATLTVTAFPVEHRDTASFGFVFEARGQRHFDAARAEVLGVPPGPPRQRLTHGEAVTLGNGRRVTPDEVLGPPEPGARLVVIGDAARTDNLVAHVRGADALVIEATYCEAEAEKARAFGHITATEAARLAVQADVGALWLTHISARYRGPEIEAEARAVFPNARVAADFARTQVIRRR